MLVLQSPHRWRWTGSAVVKPRLLPATVWVVETVWQLGQFFAIPAWLTFEVAGWLETTGLGPIKSVAPPLAEPVCPPAKLDAAEIIMNAATVRTRE